MPPRDPEAYCIDILSAGESIQRTVAGVEFETYRDVRTINATVEREFIIIGEALNLLLKQRPDVAPLFPSAPAIISFRNRLVHIYQTVAPRTVWDIVQNHLPGLLDATRQAVTLIRG